METILTFEGEALRTIMKTARKARRSIYLIKSQGIALITRTPKPVFCWATGYDPNKTAEPLNEKSSAILGADFYSERLPFDRQMFDLLLEPGAILKIEVGEESLGISIYGPTIPQAEMRKRVEAIFLQDKLTILEWKSDTHIVIRNNQTGLIVEAMQTQGTTQWRQVPGTYMRTQ